MVKAGKEGDVNSLKKMASKKLDNRVTEIISNRYSDPEKAIPFSSIRQMTQDWISFSSTSELGECKANEINKDTDNEINALKLKIQEASVKATIQVLSKKISDKKDLENGIVLASLDEDIDNSCAAVLVASALNSHYVWNHEGEATDGDKRKTTLFLGESIHEISSISDTMDLLNTILKTHKEFSGENDNSTTTKDIQNLIERHLKPKSNLIIFASKDVKLEQRVLTNLQKVESTVHCHIINEWSSRMEREKAKVGDITITLIWNNECDLDLHCICPNGDHISYAAKEGGGSIGGGYLDVDMNAGGPYSKVPVENIFFGDAEKKVEAAKGKYKVFVRNYAYHGNTVQSGDPVPWTVRVVMNNEATIYKGECKGTDKSSDVTVVEFNYEGRAVPAPEKIGTALTSSNLVSITSSVGGTIDSLTDLTSLHNQYNELQNVRNLVTEDTTETENNDPESRPLMAIRKAFDVTNRDRHFLNLSKLPSRFHTKVNQCFGDVSLSEVTASALAKRLIADEIALEELKRAGYQDDLIDLVREKMSTFGM